MVHEFCPGYNSAPFDGFVANYPGEDIYPAKDFRVEWGPIFHRGRLDGSAKVLVLGQDPAQHETICRRILVGEAGHRTQGLLAKIGIATSYVMINTYLYSVYGQQAGEHHAHDDPIAAYRNQWLDALLVNTSVTAAITLGGLAAGAYTTWADAQPDAAAKLYHAPIKHPTFPEGAARGGEGDVAQLTKELFDNWNQYLPHMVDAVHPDIPPTPTPYSGTTWQPGDLADIPERDVPAGSPPWYRSRDPWANRVGSNADEKRATIVVTVPEADRDWLTPA
jgi:hypothetical protein